MWDTIQTELLPTVIAFLKAWSVPALTTGIASLGVWAALEWVLAPIFRLPVLNRFEPVFRAVRPLVALAICEWLFFRLHESGTIDLGPGPNGWAKVTLWALLGAAGAQFLHAVLKKRGLTNEAALEAIAAKVGGGAGTGGA